MVNSVRTLDLPGEVISDPRQIVVEFPHAMLPLVFIETTALCDGLVDTLRLRSAEGPDIALKIEPLGHAARALVSRPSKDLVRFALPRDRVAYVRGFVLQSYLKGMADVNHIHIFGGSEDEPVDLIVMFDSFRPPMSPEEAQKLMNSNKRRR